VISTGLQTIRECVTPSQLGCQHGLPAFAAERRAAAPLLLDAQRSPLSIDISCQHGAQQQSRRTPLLRDGIDGWTDGHMTVT